MDATFQNVGKKLVNVGADWGRTASYRDVVVKSKLRPSHSRLLRHSDTANCAPRTGDLNRRFHRLTEAHALQDRVSAVPTGKLPYALDRFGTTFSHHIGCAKLLAKRDTVGVAAEENDAFRTEALRCDYATEANGAVPYHSDVLT
jgi:hypothetical protein